MRHLVHHRKLNRTSEHRLALRRNLAKNLFEHGEVETTLPKAKDVRAFCERLITIAVRVRKHDASREPAKALAARRRLHTLLGDRAIIPKEHVEKYVAMSDANRLKTRRMGSGRRFRTGEPKGHLEFTTDSVLHRLVEKIAPRFEDRPGGYTRVIRLSRWRLGDASPLAKLQLVGGEQSPGPVAKPAKTARRRRADARYALAVKTAKARPS